MLGAEIAKVWSKKETFESGSEGVEGASLVTNEGRGQQPQPPGQRRPVTCFRKQSLLE